MPFFSVIIPTYNRAKDLKRSLESVLAQTFTDFELLIVDDGSTDSTPEVVGWYNDDRIRYIYQDNKERSAARNNGMQQATGKYICLLDSDDIFYPEHLQVMHDGIVKDGQQVALYKTMMHYGDKSRPDDLSYAYKGNSREEAMRYVWYNGSQSICLAFANEVGKTILFPERFFWFEDVHWIMRVVMKYPLKQIEAHTTQYLNRNSADQLSGNYEKYLHNCEACIRDLEAEHGDEIKKEVDDRCFDVRVAELYLGFIVRGAIATRQLKLAKIYLRKSMKTCMTPKLAVKYVYYYLWILKASLF